MYSKAKVHVEQVIAFNNVHVLGIKQELAQNQTILQLFNCSEDRQLIFTSELKRHDLHGVWCDAISGKKIDFKEEAILLGPYEFFILQSEFKEA